MAKFICFAPPFHGHVYPTLALILGLVTKGHEVCYYATEKFRESVEAVGATFYPYQSIIESGSIRIPSDLPYSPVSAITEICESIVVIPQILPAIRALRPDCIIYDYVSLWGQLIAHALGVPAVKLYVTFPANQHFNMYDYYCQLCNLQNQHQEMTAEVLSDLKYLSALCGIPLVDFQHYRFQCEPLNIVLMPRALHPAGESFDERFLFIGASLRTSFSTQGWTSRLRQGMPTVYISLGTVINNWPEFYRICLKAFQEPTFQVVLSIGPKVDPRSLGRIPSHIIVAASVPQLDVLKQTDVFISHGGTNSVMEALFYGVPMLVIPRNLEHALFAQRIAALKLGLMIEKQQVTPQRLYEGAKMLLHDQEIKANMQTMRQTMREAGGAQRAVEAIIQYVSHEQ